MLQVVPIRSKFFYAAITNYNDDLAGGLTGNSTNKTIAQDLKLNKSLKYQ